MADLLSPRGHLYVIASSNYNRGSGHNWISQAMMKYPCLFNTYHQTLTQTLIQDGKAVESDSQL